MKVKRAVSGGGPEVTYPPETSGTSRISPIPIESVLTVQISTFVRQIPPASGGQRIPGIKTIVRVSRVLSYRTGVHQARAATKQARRVQRGIRAVLPGPPPPISAPRRKIIPFEFPKCLNPVARKSRRYGKASAQIPVLLSQKPSTEIGQFRVTVRLAWLSPLR